MKQQLPTSKLRTILPSIFLLISTVLSAQHITYVDATHGGSGNTFVTNKPHGFTRWVFQPETPKSVDDKWTLRTDTGNNGTVYQAGAQSKNIIPELTTQLKGLQDGTYEIWVFAWDSSQLWQIDAGFISGNLTTYKLDGEGAYEASDLKFTTPVMTSETNRKLHGVYIGQAVIIDGSTLNIYIDSSTKNTKLKDRTWYDGVGYFRAGDPISETPGPYIENP